MVTVVALLVCAAARAAAAPFLAGLGVADITGPVADVNLMGYAAPFQTAQGVHTRLYARAFLIAERDDPRRRWVYVSMDACMASQLVTLRTVQRLQAEFGELYSNDNVAISGTHTHASPAGFLQYLLYDITSLGFVRATFDAMVEGVLTAIRQAHASLRPASLSLASGELIGASINRSPTAYLANPQAERDMYESDVDTSMGLLRIADVESGAGRGALAWFAVHCTSLNNTNRLVSADNKGAAQLALERWALEAEALAAAEPAAAGHQGPKSMRGILRTAAAAALTAALGLNASQDGAQSCGNSTGRGFCVRVHSPRAPRAGTEALRFAPGFVAAVAQAAVGDTSPNTLGAYCLDTGLPCEASHSTCNGRNELCHGRGPAWPDDRASAAIIGARQFEAAREIYEAAAREEPLGGPLEYRSTFLDITNITIGSTGGTAGWHARSPPGSRTCPPAMGMSFAAGTTDGPGAFDFKQGDTAGPALWRLVRSLVLPPSREQQACQAPKPILLDTGQITVPYLWQPRVVQISLLRVGRLLIACVPGEFTTMSGRRLRRALVERFERANISNVHVVVSGLTGTYSSYVSTWEEYQVQRYEGASTLYGPHTLAAYVQEFLKLANGMIEGVPIHSELQPPDLEAQQVSLLAPVVLDWVPPGTQFGDVLQQPHPVYRPGETATAVFRGANPRNNLRTNGTFLLVERGSDDGVDWTAFLTDRDWTTRFHFTRPSKFSPESFATLSWDVPLDAPNGNYRFVYNGDYKTLAGSVHPFQGRSAAFVVQTLADALA